MGLMEILFGESGGSSTSQEALMTPEQQELLRNLIGMLQGGTITSGQISPAEGELGASLGALEEWARNVFGGGPALTSAEGRSGVEALQGLLTRGPTDFSDYFTKAIQQPLFETFQEDIMPGISRKYAPSGYWSSQRTQAEDTARENLMDTLTEQRALTGYQAYTDDLNRILAAGGMLADIGTQMQPIAGQSLLSTYQARINEINEAQRRREAEMSLMLQALGVRPFENVVTVGAGSQGIFGQLLTGGAQGLGQYLGYLLAGQGGTGTGGMGLGAAAAMA